VIWIAKHPQFHPDMLGIIPSFLYERDERPASKQIETAYISGWLPMKGFTMLPNGNLSYPGDPPLQLLAETKLRDEVIRFYDCEWLAIVQPDGSFEVARLD
jgi:hypothetical protein